MESSLNRPMKSWLVPETATCPESLFVMDWGKDYRLAGCAEVARCGEGHVLGLMKEWELCRELP